MREAIVTICGTCGKTTRCLWTVVGAHGAKGWKCLRGCTPPLPPEGMPN